MIKKNKKSSKLSEILNFEKKYIAIPILILTAFFVYYPTLDYDYVYCDDTDIVIRDYERIKDFSRIPEEFLSGYLNTDYYRPLQNISYIINSELLGNNPFSYKFFNLILHLFFIVILYFFFVNFGITATSSFYISLIFAIHPLMVNAVVWIPGRNDIMYALFGMISFLMLIIYQKKPKLLYIILHSIFLLLAVLSKETALVFPLLMLLYLTLIKGEKLISSRNFQFISIWIIIILLWYILRSLSNLGLPAYITGFDIFLYNLPSLVEYLGKFLFPAKLSPLSTYSSFNTIIGLAAFCLIIFFIFKTRYQYLKYNLYSLAFYFALILPGLFIAFTNYHEWNDYLECRAYLPVAGILLILGKAFDLYLVNKSKKLHLITLGIIVALIFLNINYSSYYQNGKKFYELAIKQDGTRAMFHFILARIYQKERQLELAEHHLKMSVTIKPASARFNHNLGVLLLNNQKPDSAIPYLKTALYLDTNNQKTYDALANAFFFTRNFDSAIYYWELIIKKWNDNYEAMLNLIKILISRNNFDEATKYADILKMNNYKTYELAEIFNLYGINILNKDEKLALTSFNYAIKIEPNYTKSYENLLRYYYEYKKDPKTARIYALELIKRNIKIPYSVRMDLGLIDEE